MQCQWHCHGNAVNTASAAQPRAHQRVAQRRDVARDAPGPCCADARTEHQRPPGMRIAAWRDGSRLAALAARYLNFYVPVSSSRTMRSVVPAVLAVALPSQWSAAASQRCAVRGSDAWLVEQKRSRVAAQTRLHQYAGVCAPPRLLCCAALPDTHLQHLRCCRWARAFGASHSSQAALSSCCTALNIVLDATAQALHKCAGQAGRHR